MNTYIKSGTVITNKPYKWLKPQVKIADVGNQSKKLICKETCQYLIKSMEVMSKMAKVIIMLEKFNPRWYWLTSIVKLFKTAKEQSYIHVNTCMEMLNFRNVCMYCDIKIDIFLVFILLYSVSLSFFLMRFFSIQSFYKQDGDERSDNKIKIVIFIESGKF